MIWARLLFITWLTKNTFSKRTQFLLLYLLFTIPKNYLLPAKHKVSYMSGKLSTSVLYWIFSNHLHSYCIHCKRRGMQQCHVFLNCCHFEKMTHVRFRVGWSCCPPFCVLVCLLLQPSVSLPLSRGVVLEHSSTLCDQPQTVLFNGSSSDGGLYGPLFVLYCWFIRVLLVSYIVLY